MPELDPASPTFGADLRAADRIVCRGARPRPRRGAGLGVASAPTLSGRSGWAGGNLAPGLVVRHPAIPIAASPTFWLPAYQRV